MSDEPTEKDMQLLEAMRECDEVEVKRLLDKGANPKAKIGGRTIQEHLLFMLPDWRKECPEKGNRGERIRELLHRDDEPVRHQGKTVENRKE